MLTAQPLSLKEFSTALATAQKEHHQDIRLDKNGRLVTSSPSWLRRIVRFIKKNAFGITTPSFSSRKQTIESFKRAVIDEHRFYGEPLISKKIQDFTIQKKPFTTDFYAQTLNELQKQSRLRQSESLRVAEHVFQYIRNFHPTLLAKRAKIASLTQAALNEKTGFLRDSVASSNDINRVIADVIEQGLQERPPSPKSLMVE